MNRTWTEEDGGVVTCYKGFNRDFDPANTDQIAVATWDGEIELFAIDDHPQARLEFVRYVTERAEQTGGEWKIIGVFTR